MNINGLVWYQIDSVAVVNSLFHMLNGCRMHLHCSNIGMATRLNVQIAIKLIVVGQN